MLKIAIADKRVVGKQSNWHSEENDHIVVHPLVRLLVNR